NHLNLISVSSIEEKETVSQYEYREFHVISAILQCRSKKFKAMLTSGMIETEEKWVYIPNYAPKTVELALEFMYTDQIEGKIPHDQLVPLVQFTDEYLMDRLKSICEMELMKQVSQENVLNLS